MIDELYHISSEPTIKIFEPRPSKNPITGKKESLVWAIDKEHLQNYLLPRDCPRVTYYADVDTSSEDIKRFMWGTTVKHVVAIETAWLKRIRNEVIYKYVFSAKGFELIDKIAGYYVSKQPVVPKSVDEIEDIISELLGYNVELRIMPSLWDLREAVIKSTMQYSIIRMDKASPPVQGYNKYLPLP